MPALIAAPWLGTAIAGVATGTAGIVGAKMQSGAAHDAADLQSKAAADALAFQREQQQQQQAQFEQTQHANYDQWAADEQNQFGVGLAGSHNAYNQYKARDQRVGKLGELLGMAPRVTPDLEDPTLTIPAYQGTAASMGATPAPSASGGTDPKIAAFIADYQRSHPVSEGIAPIAAAVAKQFPGVSRYMYGQNPSNNELNIGGQKYKVLGGENSPGAYWYQPGMNDAPGRTTPYRGNAATLMGA